MNDYGPRYWICGRKMELGKPDLDVIIKIFLACCSPEGVTLRTAE
jgi:hypothetical protein